MKLKGKSAIVTGGGRGIGLAIAHAFVREGAKITICDLHEERIQDALDELNQYDDGGAHGLCADVSSLDDMKMLMDGAEQFAGIPDVMVCSAGIVRPGAAIEDITPETWDNVLGVNLMGCVHPTSLFAPLAKNRKSGRIIYIASVAGQVGGVSAEVTYTVSKAGVLALTKAMARQLAPFGINVNAIAPGAIQTNMTDILNYPPSVRASIPLGDYGTVDDIASAAVYLASDDAKYMTGATLDVNGGLHMR
ncbi:MAG: SDR family NAD(P)-dependent oxidoreductase [Alphaproteobacteria bacterium]